MTETLTVEQLLTKIVVLLEAAAADRQRFIQIAEASFEIQKQCMDRLNGQSTR